MKKQIIATVLMAAFARLPLRYPTILKKKCLETSPNESK